jgi:protein arginine kinase activator
MKLKCDKCDQPASVHLTDISDTGEKTVKHLCDECAASEGIQVKPLNVPIGQLLEDFVLGTREGEPAPEITCDVCGLTFAEFNVEGRLGCPNDYDAFSQALEPMLQAAHSGAIGHIGKVPHRAGGDQQKQTAVLRLRAELKRVIATEDYERAAALRDQIRELEGI